MSTAAKSIVFLALTFAFSWAAAIGAHYAGLTETLSATAILTAMMVGPALAAIICTMAFEKGRRIEALGLRFRPNLWWLMAWLIPILLCAGSIAATLLLSDRTYVDLGVSIIAAVEAQAPAQVEAVRAIPYLGLIQIGAAISIGALINMVVLTFTEELGWRGYLYGLWRGAGFWRASLATGAIWGVWHAPAIWFYGLNYPDHRAIGVPIFVVFCILLSPIITLVRERGGSVWAAGLFHGTFNAVAGVTLGVISNPTFPWNGIVGIGGFLALVVGVVVVALLRPNATPAVSSN